MNIRLNFLFIVCMSTMATSCKDTPKESIEQTVEVAATQIALENGIATNGSFAHTVYFWLNDPESEEVHTLFQTSLKKFILNSPDITTYHIGTPANTDRPVIDSSYSYALLLTFDDKAAQDRYQEDPAHKVFIKECEALWSKVIVYDSENILN